MERKYQKVVLQVEDGMWFNVENGEAGELIINVRNSVSFSQPTKKCTTPPIPKGYRKVEGTDWQNGFTIERVSDRSRFVWIPVERLPKNGTLDGESINQRFGRRDDSDLIKANFSEPLSNELQSQVQSVEIYGGFYVSTYYISLGAHSRPQSIANAFAVTDIDFETAKL